MPKKGYKQTEEHIKNVSKALQGNGLGSKNNNWAGDEVSYRALHTWVQRNKPKSMFCEICGKITERLEASSINHTYKRDISQWQWLCRKCHKINDNHKREVKTI